MKTVVSFLVLLLLFTGCNKKRTYAYKDNNLSLNSDKELLLSKRHLDYWEALSKKDLKSAYMYEMPYQRFIRSFEWYSDFLQGNKKGYHIIQKEITFKEENIANIKTIYKEKKNRHLFNDTWYYVGNQWFHKMKVSKLPE